MPALARSQAAYDRFSAATDLPLTILAVLWLPVLIIPLVTRLSPAAAGTFDGIDSCVWAAFTVEYLVKLYLAPSRRHFVRHHLVDLAVVALPILRPLRALRLLRLLTLGRAGVILVNAVHRARGLFTHRGLHYVLLTVTALVFASSALVLWFERTAPGANIHDYGQALWWAVVTVTTIGYGDKYPVTPGGRGVAVFLMLVGIGLIGVLTATVASFFVEEKADAERAALTERLDRIEVMLAQALAARAMSRDSDVTGDG